MSEKSKTYQPLTREALNSLRGKLAEHGIELPAGDEAQIDAPHGVKLSASYNEAEQKLDVAVVKKPMLVPSSMIWNQLDENIDPLVG